MGHGIVRLAAGKAPGSSVGWIADSPAASAATFVAQEAFWLHCQFLRAHGAPKGECTFLSVGAMTTNGGAFEEELPRW